MSHSLAQVPPNRRSLADVSVMLVDDDDLLRCSLVKLLQRRGAQVTSFARAEPALEAARELPPHLVVIDLELPGMTGFEAASALAADELTAHVPVLALSGHDDPRTRAAAFSAGADAFLGKPCTIAELEAAVGRLARRPLRPQPDRGGRPAGALQALLAALARAAAS